MHEDVAIFPEEPFSFESSTHDIFWHKNLMDKKRCFSLTIATKEQWKKKKLMKVLPTLFQHFLLFHWNIGGSIGTKCVKRYKNHGCSSTISCKCSLSKPPVNAKNHVFCCFQEAKEMEHWRKWVKLSFELIFTAKIFAVTFSIRTLITLLNTRILNWRTKDVLINRIEHEYTYCNTDLNSCFLNPHNRHMWFKTDRVV